MLQILRRSFRTGIVTTRYPDEPEPAPDTYRGQVMLTPGRCGGTGDCARACPSRAIHVTHHAGGWVWELDDARCVFCGLCEEACPNDAIQLSNEYELATRDTRDLVTRVTFRAQHGGNAE